MYGRQGKNADALAHYFGEDPNHYPFEKGIYASETINFILFREWLVICS